MADGRLSTEDLVVRPGDTGEHVPQEEPARDLPLLEDGEAEAFLSRWREVQARFVDDPQAAVRDGDSLVADGALLHSRRTRAGDAWEAGRAPVTPGVSLGMPTVGVPAPLAAVGACG